VLDHDSDRAVAIITGSMVENRLERAIRSRLQRDKAIENRLFNPSGPLGSFSAKIDAAYLLGIISAEAHRDLVMFKDIRNLFAHNLMIRDFRSQQIKDKANNLRLVDNLVADYNPDPNNPNDTTLSLISVFPHVKPAMHVRHASERKKRARDRYFMTAQLITVRFALVDRKDWPVPWL
jgi:DNA-binding MltR family transcriptional regulator